MREIYLEWPRDAKYEKEYTGIIYWSYSENHWDDRIDKNYYKNGKHHRTNGPAAVEYLNSENEKIHFMLNGRYYRKEEWFGLLSEDEKIEAFFNSDEWNK